MLFIRESLNIFMFMYVITVSDFFIFILACHYSTPGASILFENWGVRRRYGFNLKNNGTLPKVNSYIQKDHLVQSKTLYRKVVHIT